jgi:hypothetical protein
MLVKGPLHVSLVNGRCILWSWRVHALNSPGGLLCLLVLEGSCIVWSWGGS